MNGPQEGIEDPSRMRPKPVSTYEHVPRLVLVQGVQPDFLIRRRGRHFVAEPDVVKDDGVPRPVRAVVGRARVAVDRVRGRWLGRPA